MMRRLEIVTAGKRMARVETYIGNRRTGVSEAMPITAARHRASGMASPETEIVDHTLDGLRTVDNTELFFSRPSPPTG